MPASTATADATTATEETGPPEIEILEVRVPRYKKLDGATLFIGPFPGRDAAVAYRAECGIARCTPATVVATGPHMIRWEAADAAFHDISLINPEAGVEDVLEVIALQMLAGRYQNADIDTLTAGLSSTACWLYRDRLVSLAEIKAAAETAFRIKPPRHR